VVVVFVQALAEQLAQEVRGKGYDANIVNIRKYEPEDRLAEEVSEHLQVLLNCVSWMLECW
jgi:hypothetical protein